jgi:hypothetical protein
VIKTRHILEVKI